MLPLALLLAVNLVPDAPQATYRQPHMASRGDMIGITFASANTIYYASSSDFGKSFNQPEKVSDRGVLSAGRHRGPRVCFQGGNVIISAIVGEKGAGKDGDVLAFTSANEGIEWSKGVRVNDVEGSAREGLHGMTCGYGWVAVTWLDLRDKGTKLYGAISTDGGKSWGKNFLVYESPDGSICQCCHPSVVMAWGGVLHVMFRNALGGARDMYLASSSNPSESWKTTKLGKGTWMLNACPMDGGQVEVSPTGKPITVWRRDKKVYFSLPGEEEQELGEGKDPSVAAGMNNVLWALYTASDGVRLRTSKMSESKLIGPGGAFPFVVFAGGPIVGAWENGRGITVEKLD
jgi:hypothetical protein